MKWNEPKPVEFGDRRDREAFLWFPLTIACETRWLERARWTERALTYGWKDVVWRPLCWLDSASSEKAQLENSNAELCRGGKPS